MSEPLSAYQADIARWRAGLDESLRKENSWLALAGLIWLEQGSTPFGSDDSLAILLQKPGLAPLAGEFVRDGAGVELIVDPGGEVLVDGKFHARIRLRPDTSGNAQRVTLGPFTMMLIERGDRLGIRLWDNERAARKSFTGRVWYPIDPAYRLTAKFIPHTLTKTIRIPNELGETEQAPSPGYVEFVRNDTTYRLDALEAAGDGLFLLVKDQSSGEETYGSGRFLTTLEPELEQVELDFNKAYNPPCAFTPFATCPLPPEQNYLPIPILAGEKRPVI